MRPLALPLTVAVLLLATTTLAACGDKEERTLTLAPESALPAFVRGASQTVREAYRFAIANPQALNTIPCYCGCGAVGHTSNLSCYVKQFHRDGTVEYDDHAFG